MSGACADVIVGIGITNSRPGNSISDHVSFLIFGCWFFGVHPPHSNSIKAMFEGPSVWVRYQQAEQ
jgi:hypothetical protein